MGSAGYASASLKQAIVLVANTATVTSTTSLAHPRPGPARHREKARGLPRAGPAGECEAAVRTLVRLFALCLALKLTSARGLLRRGVVVLLALGARLACEKEERGSGGLERTHCCCKHDAGRALHTLGPARHHEEARGLLPGRACRGCAPVCDLPMLAAPAETCSLCVAPSPTAAAPCATMLEKPARGRWTGEGRVGGRGEREGAATGQM